MRISIGPTAKDFRITADDGQDLTRKLVVTAVDISVRPDAAPTATLTCELWEGFQADIDYASLAIEVRHISADSGE